MHPYLDSTHPHVLAHQGFALSCKPNTLDAFLDALNAGADFIETDAHGTKDGIAVLFHDDEINGRPLSSLLSSELPEYIPTLHQSLVTFPQAKFNIDIKNAEASQTVAAVINELSAHNRVLITSFDKARRKATMLMTPGAATSPSVREFVPILFAGLCGLQRLVNKLLSPFDAVQIPASALGINIVSARLVKMFHKAGVLVHVWTINEPAQMSDLIICGVDGVVTDRTDLAVFELKN